MLNVGDEVAIKVTVSRKLEYLNSKGEKHEEIFVTVPGVLYYDAEIGERNPEVRLNDPTSTFTIIG